MHNKLRLDFNTLYLTGKWTGLPVFQESFVMENSTLSFRQPRKTEEFSMSRNSFVNGEDMPIKPMQKRYEEYAEEFAQVEAPSPKFNNFLKKTRPMVNKIQEKKNVERELIIKEEIPLENLEEIRSDEPRNLKPKQFLKRKSQAVKPQKLEWKVTKRIDCWLPKEKFPKQKDASFEIRQMIPRGSFLTLKDLEVEFQKDLENYQNLAEFFDRSEKALSKVPQLSDISHCVIKYSDEKYQQQIEELEKHYNYLCSEEVLTN